MQPTSQIDPNEEVTLTGSKGTVKRIKRSELPSYNLPIDYISQADTYAKSVKSGVSTVDQVPAEYRAAALQTLSAQNYTPRTKDEIAIETSKNKARPTAEALYGGIQKLKRQAKDVGVGDVIASKLTGGNYGTEADNFDTSKKLIGQSVAKLYENGRLSDKDREFYQKEILKLSSLGRTEAVNSKLNNLSEDILRAAGYSAKDFENKYPDDATLLGAKKSGYKSPGADFKRENGVTAQDFKNDAISVGKGLAQLPPIFVSALGESFTNPVKQAQDSVNFVKQALPAIVDSYKTTFSNTPEAAEYRSRHPLETMTNLIPPVLPEINAAGAAGRVGVAGSLLSKTGKAAKVAKIAEEGGDVAKVAERGGNLTKVADVISGGGSKEYIAREARGAIPQKQVLMEEGVLKAPTETGRIKRTTEALDRNGEKLAETYKNSKVKITGEDLNKALDKKLTEAGWRQEDIDQIKDHLTRSGQIDVTSEGFSVSMTPEDIWRGVRKIEQNPPKSVGSAESAMALKTLNRDAGRAIRELLGNKVPEAKPFNDRYAALKDYFDEGLPGNPAGIGGAPGGITSTVGKAVTSSINPALNYGRDFLNRGRSVPEIPTSVGQVIEDAVPSAQMMPQIQRTPVVRSNVPQEVIETIVKGKGPAQSRRLIRDMRTGTDNLDFTPKSKKEARYTVEKSKKKRYK